MKNKTPKFKLSPELESFLEKKRCLTKFKRNVKDDRSIETVSEGFVWISSPEGHSFWSKLNSEFHKIYN